MGNGGLGRLAACYLDSLATGNIPATGYGIRYDYGIFHQEINRDGYQVEHPEYWLTFGSPWEIEREDVQYEIQLYGNVIQELDAYGNEIVGSEREMRMGVLNVNVNVNVKSFRNEVKWIDDG